MKYLLDTNIIIFLLNGKSGGLISKICSQQPDDIFMSSVTLFELYYGAYKSRKVEQNIARLEKLRFNILSFSGPDAREAGKLRQELERAGQPIGSFDILLAGQARANSLIFVTNNVREFIRVESLETEDWSV